MIKCWKNRNASEKIYSIAHGHAFNLGTPVITTGDNDRFLTDLFRIQFYVFCHLTKNIFK